MAAWLPRSAFAADPVKVGLIIPLTGPFASTGKQVEGAVRLYMQRNGDSVAGRKLELIVKDDTGLAPETTKRIAQELVVQEKVAILAGFGLTPLALATAPVATEAKVPMIVMAAATSIIPTRSPFIVRSGFTLPQVTAPIADWAAKNFFRESNLTALREMALRLVAEHVDRDLRDIMSEERIVGPWTRSRRSQSSFRGGCR